MSRARVPSPDVTANAFLLALSQRGAVGALDPFDDARAIVQAPQKGVTVRTASASLQEVATLVDAGLCAWSMTSGRPRLSLTRRPADGRAPEESASEPAPLEARRPRLELEVSPDGRARTRNTAESPLAWLARRAGRGAPALIGPHHLEAGERLRRDLEQARMLPRVTTDWSSPSSGGGAGGGPAAALDMALAARQRAEAALAAVGGAQAGLLLDVCGFLKGLETVEAERGWPRRSGKVALTLALERLARHYGLGSEARGPARTTTRHWRAQLDQALAEPG